MKNKDKLFLFKYKLSLLFFLIVVIISIFLGIFQYLHIKGIMIIVAIVLLGALFSLVMGFYAANRITIPIKKITEATRDISTEKFEINIDINTKDEFEILSRSFNKMAGDIKGHIEELYNRKKDLEVKNREIKNQHDEIDALYEETTAMNDELENLILENNKSYFETVKSLTNAIEAKDSYTRGHSERVKEYSMGIASMLELSSQELHELEFGSILHDIGKIGIPETVLNKRGRFTDEEYRIMKEHPRIGYEILKDVHFLHQSLNIILEHHERMDGEGYPYGLKGKEISLLGRIVCVADAYDAMTSSRPYRSNPLSREKAMEVMINNKGTQFDGEIVDAFVNWLEKNEEEIIAG